MSPLRAFPPHKRRYARSPAPLPADYTISNEEQAILWRAPERIPEIYREPLVLFYREHQSIEAGAQSLELTEDSVKQRLSRGRKRLHEQVLAFVEGALEKTSPGKMFTLGVIAALPLAVTTAKAAPAGTAIAKGGAAAKSAATIGSLGGFLAIIGGACITWRAPADDAKSPRERQFVMQMIGARLIAGLLLGAVCFGLGKLGSLPPINSEFFVAGIIYSIGVLGMMLFAHSSRRQQQIQIEENPFAEAEWTMPRKHTDSGVNPLNPKSKPGLKAAKFMAFGLAASAVLIAQRRGDNWPRLLSGRRREKSPPFSE